MEILKRLGDQIAKTSKPKVIFSLIYLIGGALALLLLPADYFDTGRSICPSMLFFKTECPGCGMTRAGMHLLHFDLESAIYFNPGILFFFPVLAFLWAFLVWRFGLKLLVA